MISTRQVGSMSIIPRACQNPSPFGRLPALPTVPRPLLSDQVGNSVSQAKNSFFMVKSGHISP